MTDRPAVQGGACGEAERRWSRPALILLGILAAEVVAMLFLSRLGPLPLPAVIAVDMAILLGAATPLLYFLACRPLREQLRRAEAAQARARRGETMLAEAQRIARVGCWTLDVPGGALTWSEETFRLFGRDPAAGPPTFEGFIAAIDRQDRERVRASIAAATADGASPWQVDYRLTLPDGTVRHLHEEAHALRDGDGKVLSRVGTVQDVTERALAEEERSREEQLHKTLLALHENADRLAMRELMDFALEEMLRLTGSAVGYLYFYDEATERFTLHSWSSAVAAACAVADPPTTCELARTGLWGEAVRRRRAVVTNDYAAHDPAKRGMPAGHIPLARHLNLPIVFEGRIVAVAGVGNKAAPYDSDDERHLTLFSRGLWEIVQRKRREGEVEEYQSRLRRLLKRLAEAEEDERRRLADNLHDTIVQDLAAARLDLAELRAGEGDPARRAQLDKVAGLLAEAIRGSREITLELCSPLLDQFGLGPALESLAEETGRRHGMQVACDLGAVPDLRAGDRSLCYRIAKELVRNVAKHADARRLSVRLEAREGGVRLEVGDDGRGFPAGPRSGATETGGFGLFSVRERLREAGGRIEIETAPGAGARVVVHLPVRPLPDGGDA